MSNKDFQNGFALGLASGGVVEVEIPAKEEQEKKKQQKLNLLKQNTEVAQEKKLLKKREQN